MTISKMQMIENLERTIEVLKVLPEDVEILSANSGIYYEPAVGDLHVLVHPDLEEGAVVKRRDLNKVAYSHAFNGVIVHFLKDQPVPEGI